MKLFCVFSLESPHRGDSNEYTQYTIFNIKRTITRNYSKIPITVELQWLEHLKDHENMVEAGVVRASECLSQRQYRRHDRDSIYEFL